MSDDRNVEPRIGRVTAILAATIALVGAFVGNLQLDTSAEGALVGRRAQQLENRAFGSQVRATADLGHQVDLDSVVSEYERRSVFAASAARVAATPNEAAQLEAESEVWSDAATSVAALSPVAEAQRSDRQKVTRPTVQTLDAIDRYALRRDSTSDRIALERAAASERSGDFGARGSAYIGIIALLAVALFLLGLSLTLSEAQRPWMVGTAGALLAIGTFWTLTTATSAIASTPPRAVEAVANGTRLYYQGNLKQAEAQLTKAVALRNDYAEAFARLADVHSRQALDFRGGRFIGISVVRNRDRLDAAIADGERAMDLGYSNSDLPLSLGDHYALEQRYDEALEMNRRAIDLNPTEPTAWLNEAVFAAALGDKDTARAALDESIKLARGKRYVFAEPDLLAAARTALDRIAALHPARAALVRELTGRLVVASIESSTGKPVEPVSRRDVRFRTESPAELDLTEGFIVTGGTIARFVQAAAPIKTPIAMLWYTRDSPSDPWVEVVEAMRTTRAYKLPLAYKDGLPAGTVQFAALDPGACPGNREYRLDVWAANQRLRSLVAKNPLDDSGKELLHVSPIIGDTEPLVDDVLGLEVCRPQGWKVSRPDDGVIRVEQPNGHVTIEVASLPVGDLTTEQRAALDASTITRLASEIGARGTVKVVESDPEHPIAFANFLTIVGGQSDAHAGFYTLESGGTISFVVLGAWTGPDGVLRTIQIEARAGEKVGADYATEFLTTIRFDPGPLIGTAADEVPDDTSSETPQG